MSLVTDIQIWVHSFPFFSLLSETVIIIHRFYTFEFRSASMFYEESIDAFQTKADTTDIQLSDTKIDSRRCIYQAFQSDILKPANNFTLFLFRLKIRNSFLNSLAIFKEK